MNKTPLHTLITTALQQFQIGMFTAQVGHIVSFNPSTQRAQVQIGVQRVDLDGSTHNPPVINDVPVVFVGGNAHIEYEVNPSDEGLIIFAQRNIDGWKQTGGVAPNPTPRIMQMQDCIFIHGARPLPKAISGFANDGIRMRRGDSHVWIKKDNTIVSSNGEVTHEIRPDGSFEVSNGAGFVRLESSGTVQINGFTIPPQGQGDASYDGEISAQEVKTQSGVKLGTHSHSGVVSGGDESGEPVK